MFSSSPGIFLLCSVKLPGIRKAYWWEIIDYRSAFVTRVERTQVFLPAEMPLITLIGTANWQSLVIARKFLPYCHRNTRLGCVLMNANRSRKPQPAKYDPSHWKYLELELLPFVEKKITRANDDWRQSTVDSLLRSIVCVAPTFELQIPTVHI